MLRFSALLLVATLIAHASEKLSLPTGPLLTRADIYTSPCGNHARATLILCPGRNGNGRDLIDSPAWIEFAKNENLNLVGLSFACDDDPQDRGYFDSSSGSGQTLIDGLLRAFGTRQPPLLLYGFSRGAQFTYSFAAWKPDLVLAWCAYSATRWQTPKLCDPDPKGVIACGDNDETNFSFSVLQFLKGRSLGKPWAWISLANTGHTWSSSLDAFVRTYFSSVLIHPQSKGVWLDVDTKNPVGPSELKEHPTLAAWLPSENVAQQWKRLHQP